VRLLRQPARQGARQQHQGTRKEVDWGRDDTNCLNTLSSSPIPPFILLD